jgi:hypothetical protein
MLNISSQEKSLIQKVIDSCKFQEAYEFECKFTDTINISAFNRVMKKLKDSEIFELEEILERDTLDVSVDGDIRLTVNTKNAIEMYCKSPDILTDFTIMKKSKVQNQPPIYLEEYGVAFKLRSEDVIDTLNFDMVTFMNKLKHFRYKKRFSFIHKKMPLRVDMTIVKSSEIMARGFASSKVLKQPENFEIEIEFLNKLKDDSTTEEIFIAFQEVIYMILCRLKNTHNLISKSEKQDVIESYLGILQSKMKTNKDLDRTVKLNPKSLFLSYQPITLEIENVHTDFEKYPGVISIFNNYTVTEKADGERMLLFVNKDSKIFLINNRFEIINVGYKHTSSRNCILDGEFIRYNKASVEINKFMCFDIYFIDNKDVRKHPLIQNTTSEISRESLMKEFCKKNTLTSYLEDTMVFSIETKRFHYSDDDDIKNFKNKIKMCYVDESYVYHVDGLIFTPKRLAVGSMYNNIVPDYSQREFGGTWSSVFKWKPADENSIDMLVSIQQKNIYVNNVGKCHLCNLCVAGSDGNADDEINPFDILASQVNEVSSDTSEKVFASVYLPIKNTDMFPVTNQNENIYDKTVVEFVYDKDASINFRWKPYRVRFDKTELYRSKKKNKIVGAANHISTAQNVMRSIMNPLELEMLIGTTKNVMNIKSLLDEKYYIRKANRRDLLVYPLLQFHNKGIKSKLFGLFKNMFNNANRRFRLLDVACGKGGDMDKWYDAAFEHVVGIDINLDNIVNPGDGAYVRYQRQLKDGKYRGKNVNMIFLQKDVSKPWNEFDEINDEYMKRLYELVWGIRSPNNFLPALQKHHNIMKTKFDVVSCQFAIHYMFETETKLRNFCANLNQTLADGGYFFGTCLNGTLVKKELSNVQENKIVGKIKDNVVWTIEKGVWNDSNEVFIGDSCSVYFESIGVNHTEYLVSIEILEKYLGEYNIRPLTEIDARKLFKNSNKSFGNFNEIDLGTRDFQLSDETLKKFSFLNMWFVFKKYNSERDNNGL